MHRLRKVFEREPLEVIKLSRFAILDFAPINQHLEIHRQPMRRLPVLLTEHIPIPQELKIQDISAVLFFDLFAERFFDRRSKLDAAPTDVPASVLVAAVLAAFVEQDIAVPIVTHEASRNADAVDTFAQRLFHAAQYTKI